MPYFFVMRFEGGVWDGTEPRKVEARNEKDAAEKVCGVPLAEGAKPGTIRAEVRPLDSPKSVKTFRQA